MSQEHLKDFQLGYWNVDIPPPDSIQVIGAYKEVSKRLDYLIATGWGTDKNNRIEQYRRSIDSSIPHETPHDYLRLLLNLEADRIDPNRHRYLDPNLIDVTRPEENNSFIGIMPMASSAYFLMLEEAGLVPDIKANSSLYEALFAIKVSMRKLFTNKVVFFLPGRTGYEAKFVGDLGGKVGIFTNDRYVKGVIDTWCETGFEGNITNNEKLALLLECNLDEALLALSAFRPDCTLYGMDNSDRQSKFAIVNNPNPDISISTNMFNVNRFKKESGPHYVHQDWHILLARILATGTPNSTAFYITPAIDYKSVFTKEELIKTFGDIAAFNFYDPERCGGNSVVRSEGDFAFSVRLKRPVPQEMLGLNL